MITLLGASGYIGSAFASEMTRREMKWVPIKTKGGSLKRLTSVFDAYKFGPADFMINCAAFVPQPSVDLCKNFPDENYHVNLSWPTHFAQYCVDHGIPMAHIGSACFFDEEKEYTEEDRPTRNGSGYCSSYLSVKWLSEHAVREIQPESFVWRIRLPFDEYDSPRNYLTKLRSFKTVWYQTNSLTHRGDFVKSALDMIERRVAWGTYNCCNKGQMNSMEIVSRLEHAGIMSHPMIDIHPPVPGCRLSTAKLEATGCGMRDVRSALEEALKNWRTE